MLDKKETDKKYIWIVLLGLTGIAAVFRMFWNIGGDYFTFLDEYPSFDVAAGFAHAGKLYFWDFHRQTLSSEPYTRAWPHTLLLAAWFHIFGINVVAGKVLSAVFGVLFVLSVFYITMWIYESYYISVLSCLMVMTNSTVITVFRQIRMYSLWLLVMVWLMYFIFRMMTVTPKMSSMDRNGGIRGRISRWWRDNLNFSVSYIFLSVFFLLLGYFVQVNTLAIGAGILLFYLYLAGTKRERRYFTAFLVITGIVFVIAAALFLLPHYSGSYDELDWWSVIKENVSFREEVNDRYWLWTRDFLHNIRFFQCSLLCMLIAFVAGIVKKDAKKTIAYDFSMYLLLTVASSLFCFLYLLSRYYQARYMLYVAPMLAILMAWGIVESCGVLFFLVRRKQKRLSEYLMPFVCLVCVVVLGISVKGQYTEVYENESICYHRQVYEIVREDAEEKAGSGVIPIVAFDFRDYYGAQVLPAYETAALDRKNDAEIWQAFARDFPDGYMLVESAKINGFPEVTRRFIQDYSERIAGEGIDLYNIEAVRYHFLYPAGSMDGENGDRDVLAWETIRNEEGLTLRIRLDQSGLDPETAIVFLNLKARCPDQSEERISRQLCLPEETDRTILIYDIVLPDRYQDALPENGIMVYYKDGTVEESELQVGDRIA